MAKELPYFQFEPAEYLTRDVSFCSLSAQGLFINICAFYWQRECNLTKAQLLRRFDNEDELKELIREGVIDISSDKGDISVKFLDEQFEKATNLSKVNSINGSKGGRPKKEIAKLNPIESEIKPKLNPIESETKGIIEDKRIEDNKIEYEKPLPTKVDGFDFNKFLIFVNTTLGKKYKVINQKAKTAYNARLKEGYEKADIMNAIKNCSQDSYHIETGFKYATPEYFSRSATIDRFMNKSIEQPKQQNTSRTSHVHVTKKVNDIDFVDPNNL